MELKEVGKKTFSTVIHHGQTLGLEWNIQSIISGRRAVINTYSRRREKKIIHFQKSDLVRSKWLQLFFVHERKVMNCSYCLGSPVVTS